MIWEASHASSSVAIGSASSENSRRASKLRRPSRRNSAAKPMTEAITSAAVIRSPPIRSREMSTGAPSRGGGAHGSPVWVAW